MADEGKVEKEEARGKLWSLIRGLALFSMLAAAVAVAFAAWKMQGALSPWIVTIAAGLGTIGLGAIVAWTTGLVSFAGGDSDRQFFDALTDAMSDACVVTDDKGRAVYANGPYLKIALRAGVGRLVGFDVLYSGYPEFAEPVYQLMQAAQNNNPLSRDIRVGAGGSAPGAAEDSARWLRIAVAPIQANLKGGRNLWRLSDITSDRAHQEQAFSRLQFIITYLDHAPVGFFSTLPGGKVDYVNATMANWLGLDLVDAQAGLITLSKLIGEDGAKLLSAVAPITGGHRIDRFSFPIADNNGASQIYDFINRVDFDGDGKVLPARTMVMRRDQNSGNFVNAVSDGLAQFLAAVPIGIAEVDRKGALIGANAEFLSLAPSVKLGSALVNALKPDYATEVSAAIASVSTVGAVEKCEAIFGAENPRNVQLTFTRLAGMGDQISVFSLDRTEHKALEVQLAQSQKMQAVGELASGIAHDFNNVLTPIIGFADLLLSKMRPIDPAFADVMNIKQNANRAANLVRQLLAFSRKQTLQPKMVDLSEAMSDLGNLLGRVLGEKN
jgi:two-component system, cell cycle sensor histidine kinase and response regulator CckA